MATPQTGIDSILATFSLMGLGFAIIRPVAALITGVCGGLLVNRLVPEDDAAKLGDNSPQKLRSICPKNSDYILHFKKCSVSLPPK